MGTTKRERQRENRARKRAELERLERRARRLRLIRNASILAVLLFGTALLWNTFTGDDGDGNASVTTTTTASTTTTTPLSAYEAFREQPTACGAEAPPPVTQMSFEAPGDEAIDPTATVTATVATSCGDIVIALDPAAAPETVNSFVFLARQGFFDGQAIHRVEPGFVIQGGDPTADGTGGPGYTIADEWPEAGFQFTRGTVAMANRLSPGTTGSQWFIAVDDIALDPTFSVFGQVTDGMEAVDSIVALPASASRPLTTVYIESVDITVEP